MPSFLDIFGQAAAIAFRSAMGMNPATAAATGAAGAALSGSEGVKKASEKLKKTGEELQERVKEGVQGAAETASKPVREFATIFAVNAALVILGLIGVWLIVRKA